MNLGKLVGRSFLLPCLLLTTAAAGGETTLEKLRALGLPSIPGAVPAYYTDGHRERALRIQSLLKDAARFFSSAEVGIQVELHIAVLGPDDWKKMLGPLPYGLPTTSDDEPRVAFLPATDENVITASALAIQPRISASTRSLIESSGMSYDAAAREFVNLVALHELGHAYTVALGVEFKSKWFHEVMSTYFAYSYLLRNRLELALIWDGILKGYLEAVKPRFRSLGLFEQFYVMVGLDNFIWYHAMFQRRVGEVHALKGLGFISDVRQLFSVEPTYRTKPLLKKLEPLCPGFQKWAAEL